MTKKLMTIPALAVVISCTLPAQNTTLPPENETGAVTISMDSGVSIGLPAVRAGVAVGNTTALSPNKTVLPTIGFTTSVRAWKYLAPYLDFNVLDTGKATASVGSVTSTAQANTFTFNGGLRLIGRSSRVRPYVQVGGGLLYQRLTGTLSAAGQSASQSVSGSFGDIVYGAGVQLFAGRKWGATVGFDGYHYTSPINGAGGNSGTIRVGLFYQTKTSIQ